MSLPDLLAETVGDEDAVAEVSLGGDDRLAVTPTRTLVYRGDGLLSDESVAEYSHDVERIAVSTGRRKAKLTLGYGLDGDETLSLPAKRADEALHPILAGVLSATGVTDPGESVLRTFRFSELTLVVTSDRLVKHVGSAVWDDEFEEFPFADLTDLDFEEGTVATAVVLAHGGRSERFKAPNESARALRETLVDAVCAYHGVDSLEEFRVTVADDEEPQADADADGATDFGEGPDPLSASPVADAEAEAEAAAGTRADTEPGTNAEPGTDAESDADAAADPLSAGVGDADPTAATGATEDDPAGASATDVAGAEPGDDPGPVDDADSGDGPDPLGETAGSASDDAVAGRAADADPLAESPAEESAVDVDPGDGADFASDTAGEPPAEGTAPSDGAAPADSDEPAAREGAAPTDDGFDGSPFETAGVEGEDLATEVAELRRVVEEQSERLDRQSALIERLIEELRRGR
ncbi:DUF7115 domain-containing protein [Halorubrum depositum]|uniref:DUF7115 domain-containing protein n=1 Tax=Halorubrum depositum TaxID=2583992 RepID=UPI0011A9616F|nr:hypothetical protein [Halorubrum depositum]